jgi:hypothetical protein|tara:strand:+ start:372 stop:800 length:429 start_codon:yes stop_codon:yes gene_type:complete
MTSQLNVDTIVDKAGSGGSNIKIANTSTYVSDSGATTQNTVQSLCKQWVLLQSSGTSVTDSFNNTSVTDNGTGDYTLTRTNNMANATYCAIGSSGDNSTSFNVCSDVGEQTTSVHDIRCVNDAANSTQDVPDTVGAVHGDLA